MAFSILLNSSSANWRSAHFMLHVKFSFRVYLKKKKEMHMCMGDINKNKKSHLGKFIKSFLFSFFFLFSDVSYVKNAE